MIFALLASSPHAAQRWHSWPDSSEVRLFRVRETSKSVTTKCESPLNCSQIKLVLSASASLRGGSLHTHQAEAAYVAGLQPKSWVLRLSWAWQDFLEPLVADWICAVWTQMERLGNFQWVCPTPLPLYVVMQLIQLCVHLAQLSHSCVFNSRSP